MHETLLNSPHVYKTGNPNADKRTGGYGQCIWSIRTVFVDTHRRLYSRQSFHGRKGNRYQRWTTGNKARYSDFLYTLVHELVHYRWPYFREGRQQDQRVKEVLRGRTYEPKHVHLYAASRR
jgi:hypothetical protein